jgi:hypothetical protein
MAIDAAAHKKQYELLPLDWLRVWVDANHPSFQNCIIDTSDSICDGLNLITQKLLKKQ